MEIFKADNFSLNKIRFASLKDGKINFSRVLDEYFNDYEIKEVSELDRPEINSENYKIIIRHENRQKKFLLRKNKVLADQEQIEFYLKIMNHLARSGAKVSPVITSLTGGLCVKSGKDIYSMFEFIEGKYFKAEPGALAEVAREVALLHNAFNKLKIGDREKINKYGKKSRTYFNVIRSYSEADIVKIEKIIKNKKIKNSAEKDLLSLLPKLKIMIEHIKKNDGLIKKIPVRIIHSDLHPHNILMRGNKVRAIMDYDGLRLSQQARDAAFAIYRLGRQFLIKKPSVNKGVSLKNLFMNEYLKINKLPRAEVELMPLMIKDEFMRKILFVLNDVYLNKKMEWEKDLAKFMSAFEEMDYFWPNN